GLGGEAVQRRAGVRHAVSFHRSRPRPVRGVAPLDGAAPRTVTSPWPSGPPRLAQASADRPSRRRRASSAAPAAAAAMAGPRRDAAPVAGSVPVAATAPGSRPAGTGAPGALVVGPDGAPAAGSEGSDGSDGSDGFAGEPAARVPPRNGPVTS